MNILKLRAHLLHLHLESPLRNSQILDLVVLVVNVFFQALHCFFELFDLRVLARNDAFIVSVKLSVFGHFLSEFFFVFGPLLLNFLYTLSSIVISIFFVRPLIVLDFLILFCHLALYYISIVVLVPEAAELPIFLRR